MQETSESNQTQETSELFEPKTYQKQISFVEDFLVPLFRLQGKDRASLWKIQEAHSLLKCFAWLGIEEYLTYFLKMSKDSSPMMEEQPSESYWKSWMRWGMTLNGNFLTAKISESHSTEKGFSLSDILEETPDQKYFLSAQQVEAMLSRTRKNEKEGRGFSPTFLRPSTPTTTKEETPDSM